MQNPDPPLHVAFVTPTYPPEGGWGGIGTYVYQSAIGLQTQGVRVSVIAGRLAGKGDERVEAANGVTCYRVLDERDVPSARGIVAKILTTWTEADRPDVVEFPEYQALGVEFQRTANSIPSVVRLHADTAECYYAALPPMKRALRTVLVPAPVREMETMETDSVRRAAGVSSPSTWTANRIVERKWLDTRSKIRVITNPFYRLPSDDRPRKSDVDNIDVLVIGRLDYRKGAWLYPDVIRRTHKLRPETTFCIVGQSTVRNGSGKQYSDWIMDELPATSRTKVHLTGGVNYDGINDYLNAAKVGLFLSNMESYGYTHVEAMSSGLATVIGSRGGAQELGRSDIDAIHIPQSAEAAANAITYLLGNDEARKAIGTSGAKWVRDNCGSEALAADQVAFYRSVAGL